MEGSFDPLEQRADLGACVEQQGIRVKAMSWDDMRSLFAATYADEIAAVLRDGGVALLRERSLPLSPTANGMRCAMRSKQPELTNS